LSDREPSLSQRNVTDRREKKEQQNAKENFHNSSFENRVFDTKTNARVEHLWLNAQFEMGFQECGGPRSVSGEPIDDTMMVESKGSETLQPACSGLGTSNL
jgi:hypothetical protein